MPSHWSRSLHILFGYHPHIYSLVSTTHSFGLTVLKAPWTHSASGTKFFVQNVFSGAFGNVPFWECALFGMYPFWNVLFLESALFGICVILKCALFKKARFGIRPFRNVPFMECAFSGTGDPPLTRKSLTRFQWILVDILWVNNATSQLLVQPFLA